MTDTVSREHDAIVVGGGLAGLTAAAYLARGGRPVSLYERSNRLGGRAVTHEEGGFHFNLGPHALYHDGPGMIALHELGVPISGGRPRQGGHAVVGDTLYTLPAGPWSLLRTTLLGWNEKFEAGRVLAALRRADPSTLSDETSARWIAAQTDSPRIRRFLEAIVRLSTYTDAPHMLSADVAVSQLQLALRGVTYLDHGWQKLVDALTVVARRAGASIHTGQAVERIETSDRIDVVRLADGTELRPEVVVIATPPAPASAIVSGTAAATLRGWDDATIPVRAATLDVGLTSLPRPEIRFAIGVDRPLYFAVHSDAARLAPDDCAMVHVTKYLPVGGPQDPSAIERELERFLELLQPGWRGAFCEGRCLPRITVQTALATPASGGLPGRPGPAVPGVGGLYVAGDWVGDRGWLSDASRASARTAARKILSNRRSAARASVPG